MGTQYSDLYLVGIPSETMVDVANTLRKTHLGPFMVCVCVFFLVGWDLISTTPAMEINIHLPADCSPAYRVI